MPPRLDGLQSPFASRMSQISPIVDNRAGGQSIEVRCLAKRIAIGSHQVGTPTVDSDQDGVSHEWLMVKSRLRDCFEMGSGTFKAIESLHLSLTSRVPDPISKHLASVTIVNIAPFAQAKSSQRLFRIVLIAP